MLNPVTPLSRVFDLEAPEERLVGVSSLVQLAAKVCGFIHTIKERVIITAAEDDDQLDNRDRFGLQLCRPVTHFPELVWHSLTKQLTNCG